MKICVLASGSKGNCTYVEIENHKFLIDVGTNFLYTSEKLKEIDVKPEDIEAVFITHIHNDHIAGLKRFIKMTNAKVFLTKKIYQNMPFEIENYDFIENDAIIDGIKIETIKLSHDTPECKGYIITFKDKSLVYITDTGYINLKYFNKLKDKTCYIIESNHDVDMLMNSNRYRPLKLRILGDEGHISNKDCAYYLSNFIGPSTKIIILAHLSEETNTKELAYESTKDIIKEIKTLIAEQNERTELIDL